MPCSYGCGIFSVVSAIARSPARRCTSAASDISRGRNSSRRVSITGLSTLRRSVIIPTGEAYPRRMVTDASKRRARMRHPRTGLRLSRRSGLPPALCGPLSLRRRALRGGRRSGGCQALPLPGLPGAARRSHAVGGDIPQAGRAHHGGHRVPALLRERPGPGGAHPALQGLLCPLRHPRRRRGAADVAGVPRAVRLRPAPADTGRIPAHLSYLLRDAGGGRGRRPAEVVGSQGRVTASLDGPAREGGCRRRQPPTRSRWSGPVSASHRVSATLCAPSSGTYSVRLTRRSSALRSGSLSSPPASPWALAVTRAAGMPPAVSRLTTCSARRSDRDWL